MHPNRQQGRKPTGVPSAQCVNHQLFPTEGHRWQEVNDCGCLLLPLTRHTAQLSSQVSSSIGFIEGGVPCCGPLKLVVLDFRGPEEGKR